MDVDDCAYIVDIVVYLHFLKDLERKLNAKRGWRGEGKGEGYG